MCGIYGIYGGSNNDYQESHMQSMAEAIKHRGPDDIGYYWNPEAVSGIGNTRLSIIDIAHGNQPFYSDDKQIVVVQNGEIFNHVELADELKSEGVEFNTHCDTEVILRLYEKYGIDFVPRLNGMFAIAIWNLRDGCLYLIRDRVGEKPLYYTVTDGTCIFASEIKSILQAGYKPQINHRALNQYLAFNFIPPPQTMFEGVEHVPPAGIMKFSQEGVSSWQWWSLADVSLVDRSHDECKQEFMELLEDSVRIRMRSDVELGAFLSGGVDSSSVVGVMAELSDSPIKTYCIGFEDPKFDESPFAQEAADRFGTDHISRIVEPNMVPSWGDVIYYCDQPHGDISFLPTRKVAELAAEDVKVVLTGDGGDELYAGYDKYRSFFSGEEDVSFDSEKRQAYYENIMLFSDAEREQMYSESMKDNLSEDYSEFSHVNDLCDASDHLGGLNQALYIDMMHLLPGNNLVKPDRMGMSVSIETRAPFLDYRMMEFAFTIPGSMKLNQGVTKYIYKESVTDLIGRNLAYRKKQMFTVPVGDWFKNELKSFCEEHLFSGRSLSRGFFNPDYVQKLWVEHLNGAANRTRKIRALVALEIWCREFLDTGE